MAGKKDAKKTGTGRTGTARKAKAVRKPSSGSESARTAGQPFLVVALDASGGGLKAFQELLDGVSVEPNMAFILIRHPDPDHPAHLSGLLQENSPLAVVEEAENAAILPNNVYVVPADKNMIIAERALRRLRQETEAAHDKYQDLYDNAPIAYLTVDLNGTIIEGNSMTARLLGLPDAGGAGQSLDRFMAAASWKSLLGCMRSVPETGYQECEVEFKPPHAAPFFAHVQMRLGAEGGRDVLRLSIGDISERHRVEELKDEFLSLVSHELRTPLTVISGSLKVALDRSVTPGEARDLMQNAAESADELKNILDNMLEMTRHRAGRLDLILVPTSLRDLVKKVIRLMKEAGARQRFTFRAEGRLPRVEMDPLRIERVLHNLLGNAAKYSPPGSEVTITCRVADDCVVTEVRDEGPGISAADQERLFQLFSRVGDTTRTRGTGLGLVVCRRLVEAHGGWIDVESAPGKGAAFRFALPIHSRLSQNGNA